MLTRKLIYSLLALLLATPATALDIGEPAPGFSLPGSDGQQHQLAEYRGRTVVLAWFPKAFTSG